jgi:hypothetical protein
MSTAGEFKAEAHGTVVMPDEEPQAVKDEDAPEPEQADDPQREDERHD